MRHPLVLSVLLAVAAAGCVSPGNPVLPGNNSANTTRSNGAPAAVWNSACEGGVRPFFVDRVPFGGFIYVGPGTTWSATAVTPGGVLDTARGSSSPLGNGTVRYDASVTARNVSVSTIRAMLVEAGLYSATKDFVVNWSGSGTPTQATLLRVCTDTSAAYQAANNTVGACPDVGSVDWGLSTHAGNKTMSYPACKEPAEVQVLSSDLDNATREAALG